MHIATDRRSAAQRGFTLVELLVVVGIITVLIALLLPVLSRLQKKMEEVKCVANLQSLGQALTLYTQQNGRYPGQMAYPVDGNGVAVWPPMLRVFLRGNRQVFLCPSRDERFAWSLNPENSFGPASGRYLSYGYEPGEQMLSMQPTLFSYGYNGGGGNFKTLTGLGGYQGIQASAVRDSSHMMAIADSWGRANYDLALFTSAYGLPGTIHRNGANALFCDGHVQWYLQSDMLLPGISWQDPRSIPRWRMWVPDNTQ